MVRIRSIAAAMLLTVLSTAASAECDTAPCFVAQDDSASKIDELYRRMRETMNAGERTQYFDELLARYRDLLSAPGQGPATAGGVAMPLQPPARLDLPAAEVYREAVDSVLLVHARRSADAAEYSQGSAVAIAADVAITNCHVVMYGSGNEDDPEFRFTATMPIIEVSNSNGAQGSADVFVAHPDIDICLLRTREMALRPIAGVAPFGLLQIGERVYTLGNPKGLTFSFADGLLSQKRQSFGLGAGICADVIQYSAPTSPGSSGGALLNSGGLLIGITESVIKNAQNLNFAIPIALLWERYPDSGGVRLSSPLYATGSCP